jgi:phosphoglycerate dehydrogenase-like enzyme
MAAALDVFESEPLSPSSPLWIIPNEKILISSHNVDISPDYISRTWSAFFYNLKVLLGLSDGNFKNVVDVNRGY